MIDFSEYGVHSGDILNNTDRKNIRKQIEKIYRSNISQIILFGSRVRGDARVDSDVDVMLILKKGLSREEHLSLAHSARMSLALAGYDVDLLIKNEEQIPLLRRVPGTAVFHALMEGVVL